MKNKKHTPEAIYKTLAAGLVLLVIYTAAAPPAASAPALKQSVSRIETGGRDDFDKAFREGRDLIDREEWARAAEKFSEVIEKYPDGKSADAALYWLAFCHKKQKQFAQADRALDRLLAKFPASSWSSDARVMRLEIAAPLGRASSGAAPVLLGAVKGAAPPGFYDNSASRELFAAAAARTSRAPLDREDEIKIAAFQSLLAADAKRAIETLSEILKPGAKASETLKQEALRVLRSPRLSRTENFVFAASVSGVGKEFVPLLRDTLVKSFRGESNVKIRREIINALANTGDEATDSLKNLYAAESDRETKRAIIDALGGSANGLYDYGFAANLGQARKSDAGALLEIVRTERDAELRALALAGLQRFENWSENAATIDALARIYDADADEAFKIAVVRALAGARQKQAIDKLVGIAKNDKSDKLRLEAIYALRTSKNPEVLKFLEDLIK